jgi:hypothetical protein
MLCEQGLGGGGGENLQVGGKTDPETTFFAEDAIKTRN